NRSEHGAAAAAEHVDPVCGMTVDAETAAGMVPHNGTEYYFCSPICVDRFKAAPDTFLKPTAPAATPSAPPGAHPYICPMDPELVHMTRRFWIGAALTAPVFVLTMADMIPGGPAALVGMQPANWIGLACATPVVLWAGWPFFERAWTSLVNRSPNMFTLIGMGVGAAYGYSAVGTLAPGLFPEGFREHGVVPTYFDTASVITVLVLLGQVLEL